MLSYSKNLKLETLRQCQSNVFSLVIHTTYLVPYLDNFIIKGFASKGGWIILVNYSLNITYLQGIKNTNTKKRD